MTSPQCGFSAMGLKICISKIIISTYYFSELKKRKKTHTHTAFYKLRAKCLLELEL